MLTHPDRRTDTDLDSWIRYLIDNTEPESTILDYKQTLNLKTPADRREVAKDITSFANEIGGSLIYGVNEQRVTRDIGPVPARPYGIDPIPKAEEMLENVFSSTVSPILPEYRIRRVNLTEYEGKVVYIVWTPQSWMGPHMVYGYHDGRFYRRGQFRSVIMSERDIEQRYQRRLQMVSETTQFLDSREVSHLRLLFGPNKVKTATVIVPLLLTQNRVNFSSSETRHWLVNNTLWQQWLPSMYGVRTWTHRGMADHSEIEVHRNGAVVEWRQTELESENPPLIAYVRELACILEVFQFGAKWYEHLAYHGPLHVSLTIHCPAGYALFLPRRSGRQNPLEPSGTNLEAVIEPSAADLVINPNLVLKQLAERIFQAFGIWESDCFDANLSLQRSW